MTRKRNAGSRGIRPVMRIFTEGERTEINYVRGYINSYLKSKGYTCLVSKIIQYKNEHLAIGSIDF